MKRIVKIIVLTSLVIGAVTQTANAQTKRMAVTALSENMMRALPDYESALETQSLMGTIVEIVGEEGYWRQVVTPEPYTAWCTNLGLVEMTPEQINEYKAAPKYICTSHHSGVYSSPSVKSERLSDLSMGNLLRVAFTEGKKTTPSVTKGAKGEKGWAEVILPDGRKGWTPACDLERFETWAQKPKPSEAGIIATAKQFIGTPYLWAGLQRPCQAYMVHERLPSSEKRITAGIPRT